MNKDELSVAVMQAIEESALSAEDAALWVERLAAADEEKKQMFLNIAGDPEALTIATRSLKNKLAAAGDETKMSEIMNAEVEEIKKAVGND